MTSIVTEATRTVLLSTGYGVISRSVGLIVVVVLLSLLLQKEFMRVNPGKRATDWIRAFDLALVPMLIAFAIIVAARLAELLR